MAMPYILKNILRLISFPELSYSGDVSNQTVHSSLWIVILVFLTEEMILQI